MPWTPESLVAKNGKLAGKPHLQKQAADIANRILEETGDEGRALKEAFSAVKHRPAAEPHDSEHWSKR